MKPSICREISAGNLKTYLGFLLVLVLLSKISTRKESSLSFMSAESPIAQVYIELQTTSKVLSRGTKNVTAVSENAEM